MWPLVNSAKTELQVQIDSWIKRFLTSAPHGRGATPYTETVEYQDMIYWEIESLKVSEEVAITTALGRTFQSRKHCAALMEIHGFTLHYTWYMCDTAPESRNSIVKVDDVYSVPTYGHLTILGCLLSVRLLRIVLQTVNQTVSLVLYLRQTAACPLTNYLLFSDKDATPLRCFQHGYQGPII